MANARTAGADGNGFVYYQEASVDTDPGADGYGCTAVSLRKTVGGDMKQMEAYVKSIASNATITLQWRRSGDTTWTDHEDITSVYRQAISSRSRNIFWRLIVKDNAQGTGTSVFGIDW